jgi:F0F1-type ATP synthase assembly protein I
MDMIKSLLGDQNIKDEDKIRPSDSERDRPLEKDKSNAISDSSDPNEAKVRALKDQSEGRTKVEAFEVAAPIGRPRDVEKISSRFDEENRVEEDLLELDAGEKDSPESTGVATDASPGSIVDNFIIDIPDEEKSVPELKDESQVNVYRKDFVPVSPSETIRNSGLAWSAAIVLFASVAFMMLLGWFADLTFGIQPWGIVGGIILGAVIGFVQFFRTTAQILNPPKSDLKKYTLFSTEDDENRE